MYILPYIARLPHVQVFFDNSAMWAFQLSWLSKIIPRYFILYDSNRVVLLSFRVIRSWHFSLRDWNIMNSVLLTFKDNLLAHNHSYKRFKSLFMDFRKVLRFLQEYKRLVSSAKWYVVEYFNALFISFIYIKNSRGPRIDPCGTPQLVGSLGEVISSITTLWCLFDRYDENHVFAIPLIP